MFGKWVCVCVCVSVLSPVHTVVGWVEEIVCVCLCVCLTERGVLVFLLRR